MQGPGDLLQLNPDLPAESFGSEVEDGPSLSFGGMLGMLLLTAEDSIPPPLCVNEERDSLATSWGKTRTCMCEGLIMLLKSTLDTGWSPAPGPKS